LAPPGSGPEKSPSDVFLEGEGRVGIQFALGGIIGDHVFYNSLKLAGNIRPGPGLGKEIAGRCFIGPDADKDIFGRVKVGVIHKPGYAA
jgi:hypothetical protein